jgi:hypothetical protein
MSLLEILNEQAAFGFTGKINVLVKSTSQYCGVVFQSEGLIVDAKTENVTGKNAILRLIFLDVESTDYLKFVVEPEIVGAENLNLNLTFEELKKEAGISFQSYIQAKKLKPPPTIKLVINPEIIVNAEEINAEEFSILSLLTEWCLVADIYKYSTLMEYEVTNSLVSLRKKKALKVFQN